MAPLVLTLACPDRKGVVAAVAGFLAANDASITESSQFNDDRTRRFFLRTAFRADGPMPDIATLRNGFAAVAAEFSMTWALHDTGVRPRILIAVSKLGHCLYDLAHRWRSGQLPVEIAGVVSNHDDMRSFAEWSGLPFHYLPVTAATRDAQEAALLHLAAAERVELVVLARYMQVLSPALCAALAGRCINIHHSFLPSFKGAKPYTQAFERGVKLIGATAHYVTPDLDEGPIIEQGVERVHHGHGPQALVDIGRDAECAVLARAVAWHAERRVVLNGMNTVVFA